MFDHFSELKNNLQQPWDADGNNRNCDHVIGAVKTVRDEWKKKWPVDHLTVSQAEFDKGHHIQRPTKDCPEADCIMAGMFKGAESANVKMFADSIGVCFFQVPGA
jgi:hypothetical protein